MNRVRQGIIDGDGPINFDEGRNISRCRGEARSSFYLIQPCAGGIATPFIEIRSRSLPCRTPEWYSENGSSPLSLWSADAHGAYSEEEPQPQQDKPED